MFNPTRDEVRQLFFAVWRKYRQGEALSGMDALVLDAALQHPEYHAVLDAPERYLDREYFPEAGETNPFLHMSLHLAVAEQLSIDQPPGLRAHFERIAAKAGSRHAAHHAVIECLGETLWRAQRDGAPPDAAAYLECLARR